MCRWAGNHPIHHFAYEILGCSELLFPSSFCPIVIFWTIKTHLTSSSLSIFFSRFSSTAAVWFALTFFFSANLCSFYFLFFLVISAGALLIQVVGLILFWYVWLWCCLFRGIRGTWFLGCVCFFCEIFIFSSLKLKFSFSI